jgi:Uma2 family endonuclease
MIAVTAVLAKSTVDIPAWIVNLESFLRWAAMDEFPESGRLCYLTGRVWVDMSMEEMNHNQLKGVFAVVLGNLVFAGRLGRYFHDRMRLANLGANLSTEPDGMFLSRKGLLRRKARLVVGEGSSPVLVEGTPDMVLEVVSPGSVQKDTIDLRQLYWDAGIPEYWLVNPLGENVALNILRHTARGYVATRNHAGWLRSAVFGKSFRLTQQAGEDGFLEYRLAVR